MVGVARDLPNENSAARFKDERAVIVARRLRKEMTPSERALWFESRRRRVEGTHFRRQTPLGPFIVDFVCHGAKLAIEVDGGAHCAPDVAARDAGRQQWIEARGYRVLRFKNADVLRNVCAVADAIFAEARMRMSSKD